MWQYIIGILAALSADGSQREHHRTCAVAAVSVARASLEKPRPPADPEAPEEEAEEAPVAPPKAPESAVQTQKKSPTLKCVDGKCTIRVYR